MTHNRENDEKANSRQRMFDELFEVKDRDRAQTSPNENNFSFGTIRSIAMPAGWLRGIHTHNVGGRADYDEFHPAGEDKVRIQFFSSGQRLDDALSASLRAALSSAPHKLSANEIQSLTALLRGKEDSKQFALRSAHTEEVGGKTVLAIEGTFLQDQRDTVVYIYPTDSKAETVQELSYLAPTAQFNSYKPAFKNCLKSIEWR